MGFLDFIFDDKKKEQERLERERQERERIAEQKRLEEERKKKIAAQMNPERAELEKIANEMFKSYGSPKYKEDRFSDMVRNATFNPFNVTVDRMWNSNLEFGDMVSIFKNELNSTLKQAETYGMPIKQAISGYIFNMLESYYNNAGLIPKAMVDVIVEQIYDALQQTRYASYVTTLDRLKYETYFALTNR